MSATENETKPEDLRAGSRNEADYSHTDAYLQGYDAGYAKGRNQEARIRENDPSLSRIEIEAILKLSLSIGYIDHNKHEDFHQLLKRLNAHVQSLSED